MLAINEYGSIADNFDQNRSYGWLSRLRRNLNDWKIDDMFKLLSILFKVKPNPGVRDGHVWVNNKKGEFTIKSFYRGVENSINTLVSYKGI